MTLRNGTVNYVEPFGFDRLQLDVKTLLLYEHHHVQV
jgi:hypothetical protein